MSKCVKHNTSTSCEGQTMKEWCCHQLCHQAAVYGINHIGCFTARVTQHLSKCLLHAGSSHKILLKLANRANENALQYNLGSKVKQFRNTKWGKGETQWIMEIKQLKRWKWLKLHVKVFLHFASFIAAMPDLRPKPRVESSSIRAS